MSWSHTFNVGKEFAAFPCAQPDPVIIALTAVPAIAPALLEWVSFGCRDILKFRMGHGTPSGRAMKAQVIKAVPPVLTNTVQNLLKFEHKFSYAGQMFLLADLVSDTAARWTTLAYQLSGCPDALDGTTWGLEYESPLGFLPGVAHPIGGRIVHEKGHPGVAWPTGAVVPRGWHFSCEFTAKARGIFDGLTAGLTLWVRKEGRQHYDFDAANYAGGYPFLERTAHYYLPEQHAPEDGPTAYNLYVMADRECILTEFSANLQATPYSQAPWALSPLACLSQLGAKVVPDPAGQNRKAKYPKILGKSLSPLAKLVPRGPPGGKPRSKK